jgi:hypothetical protein
MKVAQRVVSANASGPVATTAPNSVFALGGGASNDAAAIEDTPAPSPAPSPAVVNAFGSVPRRTPTRADTPAQETRMSKTKRARATKSASVQFQILALLAAEGDLAREELKAKISGDDKQLTQAVLQAKKCGRMVWVEKVSAFRITKAGREWVTGGANLDNQQRHVAKTSPAAVKSSRRSPARRGQDLDAQEQQRTGVAHIDRQGRPEAPSTPAGAVMVVDVATDFDCALSSSGRFSVVKNGQRTELTRDETRIAMRYLDRIAEPDAIPA